MSERFVEFELDGQTALALPGETIWDCANRLDVEIPHLCFCEGDGVRRGACRSCVVEVDGEAALAPSCLRRPSPGLKVKTKSARALRNRRLVLELLKTTPSFPLNTAFSAATEEVAAREGAFYSPLPDSTDSSHSAFAFHPDLCIQCGACVTACRSIQCHDVIGFAGRGSNQKLVFDDAQLIGDSSCVACGECVQACPTGALQQTAYTVERVNLKSTTAVDTLCPYCGVGCQIRVHTVENSVVHVDGLNGPTNRGRLCVKGRFGLDFVNHSDRLTTPLLRRTDAPKLPAALPATTDLKTLFRPITWDEALDFAAEGFRRIRDAHGSDALAAFGSAKTTNEEGYLLQKLVRTGFGTNNIDHCTRICHSSSVTALLESIGSGAPTSPIEEAQRAEVILVIGANPSVSHPVAGTLIKNATRNGAKLIVIDPRGQDLDRFATHAVRFRPGTDVVLLNALINIIFSENLINHEFVADRTSDVSLLRDRAREFPPERAVRVCGVSIDQLREVARCYATAQSAMTFWGMGITQHSHGTDNAHSLIALALICGHVGRPGTGLFPIRGHNNGQGAPDSGVMPAVFPDYQSVADPAMRERFAALWKTSIPHRPGLTVLEITNAASEGLIRGMFIQGENPAMSEPDTTHVRAALARLDHLVVQDIFLTETAAFADLILPAASLLEKDGTVTNIDRRIQRARAALLSPGLARPDWWVTQEIGRRLGLNWNYAHPGEIFEEMRDAMPRIAGISWDRVSHEGSAIYPHLAGADHATTVMFADQFPTADGRARLVPAQRWAPDEASDSEFPLILTTGRTLEHHTGTMSRRARVLDELDPRAHAFFNPIDLAQHGIESGAFVRLVSRRGAIDLLAFPDPGLAEGVVFAPFCFAEAPANTIANPALDPRSKNAEMKVAAVRLEALPVNAHTNSNKAPKETVSESGL